MLHKCNKNMTWCSPNLVQTSRVCVMKFIMSDMSDMSDTSDMPYMSDMSDMSDVSDEIV